MKDGDLMQGMVGGRTVVKVPIELQSMQQRSDRLLKPSEVAAIFQISRSSVYRWYHEDELTGLECLGGTLRLYESGVKALADAKEYEKMINA
jgi:predicted DNA-binding transcriptional regulator AlpA